MKRKYTPAMHLPAVACNITLVCALLAGCTPGGPVDEARHAAQQGNPQLASDIVRGELQKQPNSPELRQKLAGLLLELGDAQGANIEFERARQAGATADQVVPGLARSLVELQQYRKAIDAYAATRLQDALAQAELDSWIAIAYLRNGQAEKASTILKEVLTRQPGYPRAAALTARLMANSGNFDSAFKLLDDAAARPGADQQPDLWLARADLQLYGKHDPDAARVSYAKVIALQPTNALAHSNLTQLLLLKGDLAGATAAHAAMAKALPKHPQTLLTSAILAAQKKNFQQAKDLLQPLLRAGVTNPEVLALAGGVELELGNVVSAVAQLQRAVFQAPNSAAPRKALARAHLRQGASDQALEVLAPLLQAKSIDRETLTLAANAHLAAGRAAQAEQLFSKALNLAPEDAGTKTQLALAKMRTNPAEALALLQNTADSSKDTLADLALIAAQMQQKDIDGALRSIERLKAKQPDNAQPLMLAGQVAMMKRDLSSARKDFEAALAKDGRFAPATLALATLDRIDGRHVEAEARLANFLKAEPRAVAVSLALAEAQQRRSAPASIIAKTLSDAVASNPSDATARRALINFYLNRNDTKSMLEAAQAANAALPGDLAIASMLGTAQILSGDVNQSLSTFQKLVKQSPENPALLIQLAQAETVSARFDQAERTYRKALELDPNSVDANRGLISLGLKDKRPDMALKAAKSIQKDRPDDGLGHLLEGDILLRLGKNDAALAAYRAGLDRKRPMALPSRIYAVLKLSKGGEASAQQFAEEWLKRHPQDVGFRFFQGNLALDAGQWELAEQQFSDVVKIAPKLPSALNNLAWLRVKQGKPGAVALAEQALAQAPDVPALLDTLALAQAAEGLAGKAVDTAKLAVSKAPDVASYHLTLAQILFKTGNKSGALVELAEAERLKPSPAVAKEIAELRKKTG